MSHIIVTMKYIPNNDSDYMAVLKKNARKSI